MKEFATFGGKHEVQKGIDFIDGKKQVVSQPAARNSMAVYTIAKEVKSVKSAIVKVTLGMPLNPKLSVMRDSQDYYDVKKEEVLVKTREMSVIFPPTKSYEVAEWSVKVCRVKAWRRASWIEEEVLKDADDPHLPTPVLGVYWKAARASNRLQL